MLGARERQIKLLNELYDLKEAFPPKTKAPAIQALRVAQLKPRPSKARSFLGSL
jgi:hypothetical protein